MEAQTKAGAQTMGLNVVGVTDASPIHQHVLIDPPMVNWGNVGWMVNVSHNGLPGQRGGEGQMPPVRRACSSCLLTISA